MSFDRMPYADVEVTLSQEVSDSIRACISALYHDVHREHVCDNHALITGYDFHITPSGPRLIEVNANAGGLFALLNHPRQSHAEQTRVTQMFVEACAEECVATDTISPVVAILDQNPEQQFLYPEFVEIAQVLSTAGYRMRIADTEACAYIEGKGLYLADEHIDMVYLRDTDFLLATERTHALRAAYEAGEVLITPNPREHVLLSDKQRLCEFTHPVVLPATLLTPANREDAWSRRQELVFKPVGGFASKGVYRGDKLSRARFDLLLAEAPYIAQERADPDVITVPTREGDRVMKYDIRAYAYQDRLYVLGARVYDGQVTNLRTPGGGFAPVRVITP